MLILHRHLMREAFVASTMTLLVLLGVISALFLAELLAEAAQGELPGASVLLLLVLRLPEAILMIGPLALMTGLLLALGRAHEQSEMTVIRAAGVGFGQCFVPLGLLVSAWALALLLVSGWLAPYAVERTGTLMAEAARQAVVGGLQPGRFERLDRGRLTVYVGGMDTRDGRLENVLIQHDDPEQPEVLSAASGRMWLDAEDGSRYLSLLDGHQVRHGPDPGRGPLREMRFARNDIRLPPPELGGSEGGEMAARLPQLLSPESPAERREWHWRLAAPLAALILGALAVPLSYRSPRQGRWGSIVVALALYLVYSNAIQAGLVIMERRDAIAGPGLWPIHGVLLLAAAAFWLRHQRRW
ncbi:LPS export ABC transporter permease LptF [Wenzhouxiangella limi]|uniref:Lipopolysaccharide export system permease protein LptF n=1 Tax=Wenzhouxiangella limi TaxID=2707351 RepID=A0A845V4S5_9GAMM|nr:LPS export ABC transporter permease LptF [Wenzhouxiangella limi]NDY94955.1 LPS export ABC transporter permease LptF [Wenzhouxiangella limi]